MCPEQILPKDQGQSKPANKANPHHIQNVPPRGDSYYASQSYQVAPLSEQRQEIAETAPLGTPAVSATPTRGQSSRPAPMSNTFASVSVNPMVRVQSADFSFQIRRSSTSSLDTIQSESNVPQEPQRQQQEQQQQQQYQQYQPHQQHQQTQQYYRAQRSAQLIPSYQNHHYQYQQQQQTPTFFLQGQQQVSGNASPHVVESTPDKRYIPAHTFHLITSPPPSGLLPSDLAGPGTPANEELPEPVAYQMLPPDPLELSRRREQRAVQIVQHAYDFQIAILQDCEKRKQLVRAGTYAEHLLSQRGQSACDNFALNPLNKCFLLGPELQHLLRLQEVKQREQDQFNYANVNYENPDLEHYYYGGDDDDNEMDQDCEVEFSRFNSLDEIRTYVKTTHEQRVHLQFVRYLGRIAENMIPSHRARAHAEAYRILKQLAHSNAMPTAPKSSAHATAGSGQMTPLTTQFETPFMATSNAPATPVTAKAMLLLAECFQNGWLSLPPEAPKAFNWNLRAAKAGHPIGSYRAGVCLEAGIGTRRSEREAIAYYMKAAHLGHTAGAYRTAQVLLAGSHGVTADVPTGLRLLEHAAARATRALPHGLHELALITEAGKHVPQDNERALGLYARAAALGYNPALMRLGECFRGAQLGCPRDPTSSITWFSRAASQGNCPEAELALSEWYYHGAEGVLAPNWSQAYAWGYRAALQGLARAELALGYFYEKGVGVPRSFTLARQWYQRAAAQGNSQAIQQLKYLDMLARGGPPNVPAANPAPPGSGTGECRVM